LLLLRWQGLLFQVVTDCRFLHTMKLSQVVRTAAAAGKSSSATLFVDWREGIRSAQIADRLTIGLGLSGGLFSWVIPVGDAFLRSGAGDRDGFVFALRGQSPCTPWDSLTRHE